MAIDSSTRFGVVYSTPKDFIEKISSKDSAYTNGKLFVLHGDAQGALTQGIYMVEQNDADPDGSLNIQMLSSGTYASSTNAGLMSAADVEKLAGIAENANDYEHPALDTNASTAITKTDEGDFAFSTTAKTLKVITGGQRDASGHVSKLLYTDVTLPATAYSDTWRAIKVNGSQKLDNITSTALDISAGNNIEVTFNNNKVVIAAKNVDASNADHATNATNASTADKVAQTFDISVNGSDKITYNGSVNKTLAFKGSNNIDVSSSVSNNVLTVTIDGSALATKADVSTLISNLEGALTYESAVSSASKLPTNLTAADKGKVYIASTKFDYPNSTNPTHKIEAQDMFIWDGAAWNIIDGQGAVENFNETLKYGKTTTIATVDGVNISLTMPNEVHYTSKNVVGNASTDNANEAVTSNGVYLNHLENDTVTSYNKIVGAGIVKVTSAADGTITITGTEVGDVSDVVAGKGLTGGGNSGPVTLDVNGYQGIIVTDNSVGANLKSTTSLGTIGTTNKLYGVGLDSAGYLAVNVPWTDNTDTKVTSVDNHYVPSADALAELTATLSGSVGSYAIDAEYTVLTGIKAQRDAKGHITGITYTAQKVKDTNTDEKVKATTSTSRVYLVGQDVSTNNITKSVYKNVSVYMESGKMYATSGVIESNNAALVTGGTVYTAIENVKKAATIYWETL